MKKSKTQNGITLVALIITIIVLLILAVVAIGAVQNDGIIEHAKNAREEYQSAQTNEQTALDNYLAKLDENSGSSTSTWTQNGTTVTNGKITLNVGDTVDYVSGALVGTGEYEYKPIYDENGEEVGGIEEEIMEPFESSNRVWKVLGAEKGQILLMSSKTIKEDGLELGFSSGVTQQLNTICESFGKGNYATGARSIKAEDIDRITGYDKTTYNEGKMGQYGNIVIYTVEEDGYTLTWTVEGKTEFSGEISNEDYTYFPELPSPGSYRFENTYYSYDAISYFTDEESQAAKTLLFGESDKSYWLANAYEYAESWKNSKGLMIVDDGELTGYGMFNNLWEYLPGYYDVYAVVYLESDVKLTSNGTNSWILSK